MSASLENEREEASPPPPPPPGNSSKIADEHRHDKSPIEDSPLRRQKGVETRALATASLDTGSRHDASPYLVPIDLRRLSSSPLLAQLNPDSTYSGASDLANDSIVFRKQYLSGRMVEFWIRNRSCLLVVLSSFFGSIMTLFTKLLESGDNGMHPFQILFLRMAVTTIALYLALYRARPFEFPLGPKEIRWLLVFRGIFGFAGIMGMWTAISEKTLSPPPPPFSPSVEDIRGLHPTDNMGKAFLDLADATIITFLTPSMVAVYSAIFLKQPFTRKEKLASLLAMVGVVFIARPAVLFGDSSYAAVEVPPISPAVSDGHPMDEMASPVGEDRTAADHLTGVILALTSAVGGAGAFIAIRAIGKRAHALTTTSYFAACCTIVAGVSLAVAPLVGYEQPALRFGLPHNAKQWVLIVALTVCGILTQLLITSGLSSDAKSNKATAMVYTGMIWPVGFDRWVFGKGMYWSSILGCGLIVGGAIWIALQPEAPRRQQARATAGDVEPGVRAEEPAGNRVELTGPDIHEAELVDSDN